MKIFHHRLLWPVILAIHGVSASALDVNVNVNVDASSATKGQVGLTYATGVGLSYPAIPKDISPDEVDPSLNDRIRDALLRADELIHEAPPHQEVIPDEGPEDHWFLNDTDIYTMAMMEDYDYSISDDDSSPAKIVNLRNLRQQESRQDRRYHSKLNGSPIDPPSDEEGAVMSAFRSPTTATYGFFYPLDCNSGLEDVGCVKLSANLPSPGEPLVVPCGVCYEYDLNGDQQFDGIRIIGKLNFPSRTKKATIETPYVIVEGILRMRAGRITFGPDSESITFKLTGTDNVPFKPSFSPNLKSCPEGNDHFCDLGPKPFVVAGGKLDIDAFNTAKCTTLTPIIEKKYADIQPDASKFEKFRSFLPTCRTNASDTDFFRYDFANNYGNWTGNYGAFTNIVDDSLKVTNRRMTDNGPQYDISSLFPSECLVPGQKYLLSLRIKLDMEDGTLDGEPTTCKNTTNHQNCPHVKAFMRAREGQKDSTLARLYNFNAPNYGEWYDWTDTFTLNEDQLDPTNIFSLIRVFHPEPGVDITLDRFRISLPSESTYPDPNDFCGELIPNGDAEADEFHPYPIETESWVDDVFVMTEDDGNRFFRLPNRRSSSTTIRSFLNVECLEQGVTYLASAKIRIHTEFEEEYYFYLRYRLADGSWHHYTYLQCPSQKYTDGWVVCDGEFVVNSHLASAVEVKWHFHFANARDITDTVDFDDMSIKYHKGVVKNLVVDKGDAKCWMPGAEVHIGSSTYYSWHWLVPNSFTTAISDVNDQGDGTLSIGLTDAPFIPILSLSEDVDFAADVALLTRNLKITSSEDEDGKGAYLEVLKTPNVAQTIIGVEFMNMGRKGEVYRHPIGLTYSKSLEGTIISANSIRGSNNRCISISGTSNITVSDNVAALNQGHCVYVGFESLDNLFERNYVSDSQSISSADRLPWELDDIVAAFRNRYGRNSYIGNKAIGNRYYGFSFDNWYWTIYEDYTYGYPVARPIPLGAFSHNEARSNGDSGMQFYHFEQPGKISLSNLKIMKNRYFGLFMYNAVRVTVDNSLLAENAYNLEMRWCDDINIIDVDIRGISPSTMQLVHPPYYNKPCISSGFYSPIGYRMHTVIYRWGGPKKGAALENVDFSLFDHNGQCSSSVAIDFHTREKRDGHWDYMSSFTNVQISGNKLIDAKSASENSIPDIIISDPDGSSDPSLEASVAGSFVSNKAYLTDLARGECKLYYDGIAYCQNVCYRTVQLLVSQIGSVGYDLEILRDDGHVTYVTGFYQYDNIESYNAYLYEDSPRKFAASLPHGNYKLSFLDNGKPVWPGYVYENWEGTPGCEGYVSVSNVTVVEPELNDGECDDLIKNGDMENGLVGWLHRNWRIDPKHGYLKALEGAGIGGSRAIGYFDRSIQWHGIGQNLDTRCFHQNLGSIYEVKAWYRLEKDGDSFICDRFQGGYPNRCPQGTFKNLRYVGQTKENLDWDLDGDKATVVMPNDSNGFNLLHGILKIDEKYQSIHRGFLYFDQFDASLDMILDNFSITKLEPICTGNFVRNNNFAIGDSRFWQNYGTVKWNVIDVPGASEGKALKVYDRGHESHGILQYLYINVDCLKENDRIKVFVRYQIQNSNGNVIRCDRTTDGTLDECAYMRAKTFSNDYGNPHVSIASTVAVHEDVEDPDWAWMTGIYQLDAAAANHKAMFLDVGGPHMANSIILDEVQLEPLPKVCEQLVQNPSFDDGSTSFWRVNNRGANASILKVGGQYTALLQKTDWWMTLEQHLDMRCIVEGQRYTILAKFKLLNANDLSQSLSCKTDERNVWDEEHCPVVRYRGRGCNEDFHLTLWNEKEIVWDPDALNRFKYSVPIDDNMASCDSITLEFGNYLPSTRALVIDDVEFKQQTTNAPTKAPTYAPTKAKTTGPTLKPTFLTEAPTTSLEVPCPQVGQVVNLDPGSVILSIADADTLCTVTKVVTKSTSTLKDRTAQAIIPLVRSYDLNKWESSPGNTATSIFRNEDILCYDKGCQINLPLLEIGEQYQLTSKTYSISLRDEFARFLETASFGTTASDLDDMEAATGEEGSMAVIADFIESQMDTSIVPLTSHREFWRTRSNPRAPWSTSIGTPNHPCDKMSRWRKFSFVRNDVMWWSPRNMRVVLDEETERYTLYLNGQIRTVVDDFWLSKDDTYTFDPDFIYYICAIGTEMSGGTLHIKIEDGTCVQAENPRVDVTGVEGDVSYILDLSSVELIPIDEDFSYGEEYILPTALEDSLCELIPGVRENGDEQVFGKLSDGSFLMFDPRLDLEQNTPDAPLADGGRSNEQVSGGDTFCSNVPRTFLNDDECILSSDACRPSADTQVEVLLEDDTILTLQNLTDRYVYTMDGLNVIDQHVDDSDFAWKLPHPCTDTLRSRWVRKDLADCDPTDLYSGTNASLFTLLSDTTDFNPYIRDIFFSANRYYCNETDTNPDIEIEVGDQCWRRVHDDYLSVYDMTYWVDRHPGGPYHITKWNGTAFLIFPNGHPEPGKSHPMYRWHDNYHKFSYVGRYGDKIRILDLPNDLRSREVTDYYQKKANIDTSGVIVCGSPGEVPNNKALGFTFDVANNFQTLYWYVDENKKNTWVMINLNAQDQLRQRVAWALAQILVVVKDAIGTGGGSSEWFLVYYDIFVRNAFGNYRDILKEISYSPLMAENLSFLYSKSSAYVWQQYNQKAQADENFAREIMQLFSMGLVQLNLDGTPKLDENGSTILAYTNDDIMSLSRAWTGFNLQPRRGNIEGVDNRLDPMRIEAYWRDSFPKSDTTGNYIGDYYPLCEDLPDKAFLEQGATYRFLGSSSLPELMADPVEFETRDDTIRVVLDSSSLLRRELCNPDDSNKCQFSNTVVLSNAKTCVGIECEVDEIRVVQITDDAFYEYVRTPCVNQAFFNGAKKISRHYRSHRGGVMCGNPVLPEASEACCSFGESRAYRNSKFDGERMPFESASDRCKDASKSVCDFFQVIGEYHRVGHTYFWTTDECMIRVKVKSDGTATIVHQTFDKSTQVPHVRDENENWFKVYWNGDRFPKASNECDGLCEVVDGDSCLCGTSVSKNRGFGGVPGSVEEILEKLFIGFPDPNIFNSESYTSTYDPKTGITTYLKNDRFDTSTVFEFSDEKGRQFFVKNSVETVQVRGLENGFTGYSFRNAPQFMSFVPSESTIRDAQYETEATLDHYFYHDNTAPFISSRMIQRLVISNPSPRYVKAVATAFIEGKYEAAGKSFGSGNYGDLASMFAAIYLDREARSVTLDVDPSYGALREPLLKVMSVMRNMNFATDFPITRLGNMKVAIGQMVHEFESVFSFFLPEFEPYGRLGDASLASPEATLLDMPRIVGMMNGLTSLTRYGLIDCYSGFGAERCNPWTNNFNNPSRYGNLEYNRTSSDSLFKFETFSGPSLNGGFDNIWSGTHYRRALGKATIDPKDATNYVYQSEYHWNADFFSQPAINADNWVVKFQYLASEANAGGCVGYSTPEKLHSETRVFCHVPKGWGWAPHEMVSNGEWISCQFEVPKELTKFRIAVVKRMIEGDSYFDNFQIGLGSGTYCGSDIVIEDKVPPGKIGQSGIIVDELATLLTAGRLSDSSRKLISDAYDRAGSANDGLRIAQEMILTSSEFHTTNPGIPLDEPRSKYAFPSPSGKPYKALVYLMLNGGCDSFNMLAPHTCSPSNDVYQSYLEIRDVVAIAKNDLLPIDAENQNCTKYGIHPDLPVVQKLYNDGDLLFFANTGVMTQPVNKYNYWVLTNTQLFAHNFQQLETKRIDPYDKDAGTGVIGRMADVLNGRGHNVGSFSVDRFSTALVGTPGISDTPMIVNRYGVPSIYLGDELSDVLPSLHNATPSDSGFFAETWSDNLMRSLDTNEVLGKALEDVDTVTPFPGSYLSSQLKTVAKLMSTREERGVDTDTFYVEIFGYDTHASVEENLIYRFIEVNEGLEAFATEMKTVGLWNNVTLIQTSDFARTLGPNSGLGTDHAWGGNYMMMGGSVKGKQILGEYPDTFAPDGPLNIGRGRLVPTTPWEAVFTSIASWLGVPDFAMEDVCPNMGNFDSSYFFDPDDLFDGIPEPQPTASPTFTPPTDSPTERPSAITLAPTTSSPTIAHTSSSPSDQPSRITSQPSIGPTKTPTNSPTQYPTFTPICEDDPNYRHGGLGNQTCAFAGLEPETRCTWKDENTGIYYFEPCRKACGRCSCQNDNFFVKNDPEKTCTSWVRKKPNQRCILKGAREHCKKVCGEPCCMNDKEFRYNDQELKDCKWVAKRKNRRCKFEKVAYYCPQACNFCS